MRSRRRHVAAIAALALLPAAASWAQVDPHVYTSASALKGDWRPIGDSDRDPSLVQVACDPDASLEDCARQQGTYQADVFLRIGASAGGNLRMISDGALDATVATVAAKPTGPHDTTSARTFVVTLADGSGTAKLVFGGLDGHCAAPESLGRLCFDIVGAPTGAVLADGTYEEAVPRTQPARTQTLGDAFAGLPPNFLSMLTCADITQIDPDDLRQRGCTSPIFLSPNKNPFAGSKRYDFAYFADHNYVIPFGWQFADRSGGVGGELSKIIETGQDLTESQSSSLGVNASVNLYFVTASVKHNTKTELRVENMYDNSLTYSQFSYLQTQFALVLDKENVGLDPYFLPDALNLLSSPKPDYSWFIGRWGTHYVHSATFGETGKLFSTYTKSDVEQLHENGVDVSTAVEAGVSYMGMGASVGVDVDNAKSQLSKMRQTLGNDFGAFQCSGGVTCDGKTASAGNTPPILLDLRPISDLFGPPFFQNVAVDRLVAVRKGLGDAIVAYAFRPAGGTDGRSSEFGRITGLTVQPQIAGTLVPPTITLTLGDVTRTFNVDLSHQDGKSPIPLQQAGELIGFGWSRAAASPSRRALRWRPATCSCRRPRWAARRRAGRSSSAIPRSATMARARRRCRRSPTWAPRGAGRCRSPSAARCCRRRRCPGPTWAWTSPATAARSATRTPTTTATCTAGIASRETSGSTWGTSAKSRPARTWSR